MGEVGTKKSTNKGSTCRYNKVHLTSLLLFTEIPLLKKDVRCTLLSLLYLHVLPWFVLFFVLPSLLHPSILLLYYVGGRSRKGCKHPCTINFSTFATLEKCINYQGVAMQTIFIHVV